MKRDVNLKLVSLLSGIPDIHVESNIELTRYSTMKLKAFGDLIIVNSIKSLQTVVKKLTLEHTSYKILGLGANQVLRETSDVPYIKLNFDFEKNYLENLRDEYTLPASITLSNLTAHAIKFNINGWDYFTGVPATLGGAICMNAGTNLGEISDLIKAVKIVDLNGEIREIKINKKQFSYRKNHFLNPGDIIVEATLVHLGINNTIGQKIRDYLNLRTQTQPLTEKTCGCTFKNNSKEIRAGNYIDKLGLKGFQYKGLRISTKHANFIENIDEVATFSDFCQFINIIKHELYINYGIEFELEIQY